jgi:hypothetical protein
MLMLASLFTNILKINVCVCGGGGGVLTLIKKLAIYNYLARIA